MQSRQNRASKRKRDDRDDEWLTKLDEWIKIRTTFENAEDGNEKNVTKDLRSVKNAHKAETWLTLSGLDVPRMDQMQLEKWDGTGAVRDVVTSARDFIRKRSGREDKEDMVRETAERVTRVLQRALWTAVEKVTEEALNDDGDTYVHTYTRSKVVLPRAEPWWVKYAYTCHNARSIKIAKLVNLAKKAES